MISSTKYKVKKTCLNVFVYHLLDSMRLLKSWLRHQFLEDQAGSNQGVRPDRIYSCFPLCFELRKCLTDGHVKSVFPSSVSLDLRPNGKLGY